jgi:hypothetical protein
MNEQNTRSSEALDLDRLEQLAAAKDLDPLMSSHITSPGYTHMANLTEIIDGGRARCVAMLPKGWSDWLAAIDNAAPALIARARRADELEQEVARLKDADVEHEASFDLRWKADLRAIERWRGARKDRRLILPDHADLCVNALDWVETAERALKDRDAEVERLKSAWQERENEALTLRAANADFARSFSELQDELAAAQQDKARLDWLEREVAEHRYHADFAIQQDEEDGVWFTRLTRHVSGELPQGLAYDDGKQETVRAALDAARAQQIEVKP